MNLRDAGAGRRCRSFLSLAIDPVEGFSDRVQQVLIVERLVQKLTAPAFMACTNVVLSPRPVAGYETHWKLDVGFGQFVLEIEAAHPGQPYIEDQTSWSVEAFVVQKFFSGGEGFDARPCRPDETV